MTRRNMILSVLFLLITASVIFHAPLTDWATERMINVRLNIALYNVKHVPVTQLVTDDVVREAVADGHGLYSARVAMFDHYLCPTFGDKHNAGGRCYNALYGVNAGQPDTWYTSSNIPLSVAPGVSAFRQAMMERMKFHLSKPENLKALYNDKKWTIVNQVLALSWDNEWIAITRLEQAHSVFHTFGEAGHEDLDPEILAFARRRYSEGGKELIKAYDDILSDLTAVLKLK